MHTVTHPIDVPATLGLSRHTLAAPWQMQSGQRSVAWMTGLQLQEGQRGNAYMARDVDTPLANSGTAALAAASILLT